MKGFLVTILEEAEQLVADRLDQYAAVRADMYFMAGLAGDLETQRAIWEEAWENHESRLLSLLVLVELGEW